MKRAKTQSLTTDNLRQFWLAQIEVFDEYEYTGAMTLKRPQKKAAAFPERPSCARR
jgi:hypothetical protein